LQSNKDERNVIHNGFFLSEQVRVFIKIPADLPSRSFSTA